LVYDIVDFYTSPDSRINKILYFQKKYLLKKANIITAISNSLIKNYQKILPNIKINLVPQGFNLIKKTNPNIHPEIENIKKLSNKIGFIGGINNRLDFQLLFDLIAQTPKYNYIFVGPLGYDLNVSSKPVDKLAKKLFSFKNVTHINLIPKSQIGQFINTFDVTIIPYDVKDDFNRLCYPMKLFEYFTAGKPVLSTPIEELKNFPDLVFSSPKALDWKIYLDNIFSKPWPKSKKILSQQLAKDNSWENKIKQILKKLYPNS
jgi:hypothetical protein